MVGFSFVLLSALIQLFSRNQVLLRFTRLRERLREEEERSCKAKPGRIDENKAKEYIIGTESYILLTNTLCLSP